MTASSAPQNRLVLGAIGLALLLGVWELVGVNRWAGLTFPPLSDVVATLISPGKRALFIRAVTATLTAFGQGLFLGTVLGLLLSAVAHAIRPLSAGLDSFAALLHAIPAIALAPIFMLTLPPEQIPAAIASINVLFITYASGRSALGAASAAHHDVLSVFGASRLTRYVRLELPAALPGIASGLKLAVPGAVIGVIVGEWFGAPRGLGLLIISAMQNFQIPLLWSAVVLAALLSMSLYGVFAVLESWFYKRYR